MTDAEITGTVRDLKDFMVNGREEFLKMRKELDALQVGRARPATTSGGADDAIGEFSKKFEEHREALFRHKNISFEVPTFLDRKAFIASTDLFVAQPASDVQGLGRFPYQLRRLFRSIPATAGAVFTLRETSESLSPLTQTEGSDKAESTMSFTGTSTTVPTIAHFINVSRQALDDVPGLAALLDSTLRWGLERKVEDLILNNALPPEGLTIAAASFDTSILSLADGWHPIDCLGAAATQLAETGFNPSFAVVHPRDWFSFLTKKTDVGEYILATPRTQVGRRVFDLDIAISDQISVGDFLVGDSSRCVLRPRMLATVEISLEHGTNFTKNLATIRGEERVLLEIYQGSAFVTGSLTSSPA